MYEEKAVFNRRLFSIRPLFGIARYARIREIRNANLYARKNGKTVVSA